MVRVAAAAVLFACAWTGFDGLRRAGIPGLSARVVVPWDADRLAEGASDARILALRPVSPFARFRDALARADGADGEAFRAAARGVLRWGRNQPGTLFELGRVALARWKSRGEAGDREVGEALLGAFTNRSPAAEGEGARAWLEVAPADADPWPVFGGARADLHAQLGVVFADARPKAAWRFFEPDLRRGTLDPRAAGTVLMLARARHDPADAPLLASLAKLEGVSVATSQALLDLSRALVGGR